MEGVAALGRGAGELDGGTILGDAVDGESVGCEPDCDDALVFVERAKLVSELFRREPLVEGLRRGQVRFLEELLSRLFALCWACKTEQEATGAEAGFDRPRSYFGCASPSSE